MKLLWGWEASQKLCKAALFSWLCLSFSESVALRNNSVASISRLSASRKISGCHVAEQPHIGRFARGSAIKEYSSPGGVSRTAGPGLAKLTPLTFSIVFASMRCSAMKMLDEVRHQLVTIHVGTKDSREWDLTRNGAYRFSATGKKDLAYAALFDSRPGS